MVVGGMAARADLTLSELDELHMAVEELLRAARDPDSTPRYRLQIEAPTAPCASWPGRSLASALTACAGSMLPLVQRVVAFDVARREAGSLLRDRDQGPPGVSTA